MDSKPIDKEALGIPDFELQKEGRYFNGLSIHPNGKDWLFGECYFESNPGGECFILKYNLESGKLFRYELPQGYNYQDARFSSTGNWIVATRHPIHTNTAEATQSAWDNTEIVMFRTNGTDFSVLPIPKAFMVGPTLSPDGTKIAFSTPKKLNVASKTRTKAIDFDVYEFDLKTKKTELFAGPFHFISAGTLNYVSQDFIILDSFDTLEHFEKSRDMDGDRLYGLNRFKKTDLQRLTFDNLTFTARPSIDLNGDLYFSADDKKRGASFFHVKNSRIIQSWGQPYMQTYLVCVSPDGSYMGFTYLLEPLQHGRGIAFGLLKLSTTEWVNVVIPALNSAQPISIKK